MSTEPFIPTGPLPLFRALPRDSEEPELRVPHASRVLVAASRGDELPDGSDSGEHFAGDYQRGLFPSHGALTSAEAPPSPSSRDATTNTRDACGTQPINVAS